MWTHEAGVFTLVLQSNPHTTSYLQPMLEDPAIDNEVLNIRSEDRLVMITSAGCNALDYLLKGLPSFNVWTSTPIRMPY
jgi:S-adenosylmethionine:diacylglycerol 3-amino-3-carboxypropyl transferase